MILFEKYSGQRTQGSIEEYQLNMCKKAVRKGKIVLGNNAIENNRIRLNLLTNIHLHNEFLETSLKCATIVTDLINDLYTYKNERKNPSWFEKLILSETLKEERLKIVKPLIRNLEKISVTEWNLSKYLNLIGELEQVSRLNKSLTYDYNKGDLTGQKPTFKAGEGDLQKLFINASDDLMKHNDFFKMYFV